ncbi:MAG: hypothetical protein KDA63_01365, partial [Planctomycetales bacterium]|nr:hypothetical protein [Planctomycetales bacterium]
ANEAQAGGWGISINSGYPGYYGYGAPIYAPAYGPAFGYGYRTYGFYGAAPLYRYPAYYPPAVSFSFGGGGGGGHYHHHGRHCR